MEEATLAEKVQDRRRYWWYFPPYRYSPKAVCGFESFALVDMVYVTTKKGGTWSVHAERADGSRFMFLIPADEETRLAYLRLAHKVLEEAAPLLCLVEKEPGVFRLITAAQKQRVVK